MFSQVSDWIEIEYANNVDEDEAVPVFGYKDKFFYLRDFIRCHNNPWGDMLVPDYIHAYQSTEYHNPYFIELSSSGDAVRLYLEVTDA